MRCFLGMSGPEAGGAQVQEPLGAQSRVLTGNAARRLLIFLLVPVLLLLAAQKSPAPVLPVVLYTASPTNGLAPLTVQFNASATATSGATVTNWTWNFNDATPPVNGQNPIHTYTGGGVYTVSESNYVTGGVIVQGSLTSSSITPAVITTTGAAGTVSGFVILPNEPAGFFLTNGVVLVSLPGTFPGQPLTPTNQFYPSGPTRFAAVTITPYGGGYWFYSAQLTLPLGLYPNGIYAQPTWPSAPYNPPNPLSPEDPIIIIMQYNDGQGHTGILVGGAVPEPSA
jgi:hypothetical protein